MWSDEAAASNATVAKSTETILSELRRMHAEQMRRVDERFASFEARIDAIEAGSGGASPSPSFTAPPWRTSGAEAVGSQGRPRGSMTDSSESLNHRFFRPQLGVGGDGAPAPTSTFAAPAADSSGYGSGGSASQKFSATSSEVHKAQRARAQVNKQEHFLGKFAADEVYGKTREKYDEEIEAKKRLNRFQGRTFGARLMLMPSSRARLLWDAVSMLLVLFIAITLPFRVAFTIDCTSIAFAMTDFAIDVFFICDLMLNFRTAYVQDGELVTDFRAVASKYLAFWFWLDLLSSVPIDWFIPGNFDFSEDPACSGANVTLTNAAGDAGAGDLDTTAQVGSIIRIFKVFKLLRLLRITRVFRYLTRWEEQLVVFNSSTIRMIKLFVILLVFSHWNGCFQFLVAALGKTANGGEFDPDSWVGRTGIDDDEPIVQWTWAYFHAASQLLAISPGLVQPGTVGEVYTYLASMILGATLYAVFVASVTAFFADADPSAREYRSKIDMVNQYMRHAQLPRALRQKLRTYYELRFPGKRAFDEFKILSELSSPLTQEVRLHKCRTVLAALNIIEEDKTLAFELCEKLQRVVFVAGDYIIHEREASDGMYFISSGCVEVLSSSSPEPITTLGTHSFFGEMALLAPSGKATASVRVITYFEGYLLSYDDYLKLVHDHPSFHQYLQAAAALRLRVRAELQGVDKSADLQTLFDMLDPMKRKLNGAMAKQEMSVLRRLSQQKQSAGGGGGGGAGASPEASQRSGGGGGESGHAGGDCSLAEPSAWSIGPIRIPKHPGRAIVGHAANNNNGGSHRRYVKPSATATRHGTRPALPGANAAGVSSSSSADEGEMSVHPMHA